MMANIANIDALDNVKIITWNLAGAGTIDTAYKIDKAIEEANKLRVNVLVFQETKATSIEWIKSTIRKYDHQGWKVFECINKSARRNGVAILINTGNASGFKDIKEVYADSRSDHCWNWEKDKKGNTGRVIAVSFMQGTSKYVIGCFYGPSSGDIDEKASFYKHYSDVLKQYNDHNLIL